MSDNHKFKEYLHKSIFPVQNLVKKFYKAEGGIGKPQVVGGSHETGLNQKNNPDPYNWVISLYGNARIIERMQQKLKNHFPDNSPSEIEYFKNKYDEKKAKAVDRALEQKNVPEEYKDFYKIAEVGAPPNPHEITNHALLHVKVGFFRDPGKFEALKDLAAGRRKSDNSLYTGI